MNEPLRNDPSAPPLALAEQVDEVCARYEAVWQSGGRPRLEEYLAGVQEPQRAALLRELIPLEMEYDRGAGETPWPEEYLDRFPELDPHWLASALQMPRLSAMQGEDGRPKHSRADLGTATVSPSPDQESLPYGDVLCVPGYQILEELGRGGMGVVYRARQVSLDRMVALKMVLAGGHGGPEQWSRFQAEAVAIARLDHPHIVRIYEVGKHSGCPYLALEFCSGGTLAGHFRGQPQSARTTAELVQMLAGAVEHAHVQGVVHRDLKPANVLLGSDGTPKITDFGLAKVWDASVLQTQTGLILGTPMYMAPEQAAGRANEIGAATDVYALGAILYEALTGRPPFRAATFSETLEQVKAQEPVSVRQLQPKVPRDLETICQKCLQKEPARRYATAAGLAADLGRFLAGEPIVARRVRPVERLRRWCLRNPIVAGLVASIALVLVLGAAVSTYFAIRAMRGERRALATAQRADREAHRANQAAQTAAEESDRARAAEQEARQLLYARSINLMQAAWDTGQISRLQKLLGETEASPEKGFEWYFWQRLCHLDLHTLIGHCAIVGSVSWSPDGRQLATGSWDGTAKVWDAASGQERLTLKGHIAAVMSVSWSPDGTRLATGGTDGTAKVWDAAGGQQLLTLKGHTSQVLSVSWAPDGRHLATASEDGTARVWDAAGGRELLTLKGHTGYVYSVSWSPDGTRLATGGGDGTAKVWDPAGGWELLALKGHTGYVYSVSWSPDGTRLATGGGDGTARVWDPAGGQQLLTLEGHMGHVVSVSWSPDGRHLATASNDATARAWDAAGGRELLILKGHAGQVGAVSWAPDGKSLATGSDDGTAKVWDAASGRELLTLKGHTGFVYSVSWSPDGRHLATGGGDDTAKVWDAAGGRELLTLKGHTGYVYSVSWSPDGTRLATGGGDGTAKVWDPAGGWELLALKGHTGYVYSVSWSPDGTRLATGGGDGTARVWDPAGGQQLLTLEGHMGHVVSVSWSPDGRHLATASNDGTARAWDAAGGRELLILKGHAGQVGAVSWAPDGKSLATGSDDGTAKVWDAASGRELLTLKGHTRPVRSVSWSPDGKRLATGSLDGTVKVWDTAGGRELLTLKGHMSWVRAVSWAPDGQRLAAGSDDGTVEVWEAADAEAVREWARQDHAVQDLLAQSSFRRSQPRGFIQTWLLLLPLAAGEGGAKALEQEQLPGEAQLQPRPGDRIRVGGRQVTWQEHRSPLGVLDFNAVLGRSVDGSVAYAVCYLESSQAREDLWVQVGSDDQAKVYLNGRAIYQYRQPRALEALDTVGPVALKRGINVLLLKVVNETGNWSACSRLVDQAGLPAEDTRVKLSP